MQCGQGELPVVGAGCSWATQQSFELDGAWKRPDMMCVSADEDYALIFEHKVNAALHPGQLDDYRRIGDRFGQSAVVLITARRSQLD